MKKTILRHLRGNVIAYTALFFALTAGTYAATKAPKNSVVTKSIVKGAVKTKQLGNGVVTEPKVKAFAFTNIGTFTNAWAPVGGTTVSYGKDVAGFVHLRGRILGGTRAAPAFNLPAGFRPAENESFGSGTISGGNSTPCIISVNTAGDVIPGTTAADTGCASAGSTLLYGIVFKAAG